MRTGKRRGFKNIVAGGLIPALMFVGMGTIAQSQNVEPGKSDELPQPDVSCSDRIAAYKDYIFVQLANSRYPLDDDTLEKITDVLQSKLRCDAQIEKIDLVINAFWASEPWCKSDKKLFLKKLTAEVRSSIPKSGEKTINDLFKSSQLSCSETLSAAFTVVRLYVPDFEYVESSVEGDLTLGNPTDLASSSASKTVSALAKEKSLERQLSRASKSLRSCQGALKRARKK